MANSITIYSRKRHVWEGAGFALEPGKNEITSVPDVAKRRVEALFKAGELSKTPFVSDLQRGEGSVNELEYQQKISMLEGDLESSRSAVRDANTRADEVNAKLAKAQQEATRLGTELEKLRAENEKLRAEHKPSK